MTLSWTKLQHLLHKNPYRFRVDPDGGILIVTTKGTEPVKLEPDVTPKEIQIAIRFIGNAGVFLMREQLRRRKKVDG